MYIILEIVLQSSYRNGVVYLHLLILWFRGCKTSVGSPIRETIDRNLFTSSQNNSSITTSWLGLSWNRLNEIYDPNLGRERRQLVLLPYLEHEYPRCRYRCDKTYFGMFANRFFMFIFASYFRVPIVHFVCCHSFVRIQNYLSSKLYYSPANLSNMLK